MQKCLGCGSPSLGEYCPRCLREQRPDLTGVIRKGGASPSTVARQADAPKEPRRAAPIGFTAEPAKPSGNPGRKPKDTLKEPAKPHIKPADTEDTSTPSGNPIKKVEDTLTQPTESESLTHAVNVKFTASMRERLENLARLRVSSIPDIIREAVGDLLEANHA